MTEATTELLLQRIAESHVDGEVTITWQGGEPAMAGLEYFRRVIVLTQRMAPPGLTIRHALQTNGTLLDDEWAEFLADQGILVGLSIDGPAACHDAHRVNHAGRGSHAAVERAWRRLQRHGVDTNILCTVHAANQDRPLDVYRYFRDDLGAQHMQFIPIVERVRTAEAGYPAHTPWLSQASVSPRAWGEFLMAIFDEWASRDIGQVFVTTFENALAAMIGRYTDCVHAPTCGRIPAVMPDGAVYPCDHFVDPSSRLGLVDDAGFADMLLGPPGAQFAAAKRTALTDTCLGCPVLRLCWGGCPKDRFAPSPTGQPGHNILCPGYRRFFTHAYPVLREILARLRQGIPAGQPQG